MASISSNSEFPVSKMVFVKCERSSVILNRLEKGSFSDFELRGRASEEEGEMISVFFKEWPDTNTLFSWLVLVESDGNPKASCPT